MKWNPVWMLGVAALAAACTGKNNDTSTTDTTDTSTTDTSDTGTSIYDQPYSIGFQFYFGYWKDDTHDQFVTYQAADGTGTMVTQDLAAKLTFYQEGSGGQTGDAICAVVVTQPGPVTPSPLNDAAVKKGFLFDWGSAEWDTSDCDGLFDPSVWGTDLATSLKTVTWGVGLTGTVDSAVKQGILDQVSDDQNWSDYLAGARPYLSTTGTLKSADGEFYAARATEMDTLTTPPTLQFNDLNDNGAWEDGETGVYILGSDVAAGPVTGGYYVVSPYALSFTDHTLDEILLSSSR